MENSMIFLCEYGKVGAVHLEFNSLFTRPRPHPVFYFMTFEKYEAEKLVDLIKSYLNQFSGKKLIFYENVDTLWPTLSHIQQVIHICLMSGHDIELSSFSVIIADRELFYVVIGTDSAVTDEEIRNDSRKQLTH